MHSQRLQITALRSQPSVHSNRCIKHTSAGTSSQHRRLRWQHLQITNIPGRSVKRAAKTLLEGGSPLFAKQDLDSRPSIMSYYEESWCEENVWGWKKSFRRSDTSTVADAPATTCPLQLQSLASWHQDRNHTSDGSISRRPQAVSA